MKYLEIAQKLKTLGCEEIPRRGGWIAPGLAQPGEWENRSIA